MCAVLDPADEGEVEHISQDVVDPMVDRLGGPVQEAAEPTAGQIVAIRARVLRLKDAPCADVSIPSRSTPDIGRGRPPFCEEWSGCWRVSENLLLLLLGGAETSGTSASPGCLGA